MRPRSLRAQLTLVFTAFAAAVVLAAAVGTAVLIRHAVWGSLDPALGEEAETLVTLLALEGPTDLPAAVARVAHEDDMGGAKFIRVTDRAGAVLARSGTAPPGVATLTPREAATLRGDGRSYRVVRVPLPDGGWCELGVRVEGRLRMLRHTYVGIAAAAIVVLATLAALAWSITTRATAELGRLAAELETLEAGSLDRRLAPRRTAEVDRLAGVLNRLLGRLEAGIGHLRRFTADAAHELRTPITALRAHLEVALGRADSTAAARDGLLDALEQTERLGRLAEDLLTLSAVEAGVAGPPGHAQTVALDALAREVAEFLDPVAQEQGRRFACDAEARVAVRGAPDLLKRVLLNLVDNAFRHTPATAAVRVTVRADDGTARLEVRDEGPGIAAADLPYAFERFHRGAGAESGTGLGLALCREIVRRHGGDIALHSAPGKGTTVAVTLPLASA